MGEIRLNISVRGVFTAALLSSAVSWGTVAHALPVSGTFTLTGDALGQGVLEDIATGEFTTSSDPADVNAAGYTDADGNVFATVSLDVFNVFDLDGRFGNFSLADTIFVPSDPNDFNSPLVALNPVVAILDGVAPDDRVIGFEGALYNGMFPWGSSLVLNGPNDVESANQPAQFEVGSLRVNAGVSGIVTVPEPNALALLGAGMVAFGIARRRRAYRPA